MSPIYEKRLTVQVVFILQTWKESCTEKSRVEEKTTDKRKGRQDRDGEGKDSERRQKIEEIATGDRKIGEAEDKTETETVREKR